MKVEFLRPGITDADIAEAVESIKTGWLVNGFYSKRFEDRMEKHLNVPSVTLTSSCTASLHMSLMLAGVKGGDEVITTPISWVATANVILYQGAKVVFADVDPLTGILDIHEAEKAITPKTKAIIVVHLYGQMADMVAWKALGEKYNVKIIEDAAHALEAERDGFKPGQLGFTACFSFHAAKNITSGQGGAMTGDKFKCQLLRRDGVANIDGKRVMLTLGHKYDLTDFQAAMLIGQLDRIKDSHAQRQKVFDRYRKELKVSFPKVTGTHACHMFVIWVNPIVRDQIRKEMEAKGIQTSIHYPCIHLEPFYKEMGFKEGMFPVAEKMSDSIITLPTYALTEEEQSYVIKETNRCVSH